MKLQKNRFLDPLFRKLSQMSFEQKIQSSFLTLLTLVLVFFPLVKFSPTSTEIAGDAVGLLSATFFKTGILVIATLAVLIGWNTSVTCKHFIHSTFGFKDNDHLLNFILLWILVTGLVGIGEGSSISHFATSTISTTFWYGILIFCVFLGLIYSLVMMLKEAKILNKGRFMSVMKKGGSKGVLETDKRNIHSLFEEEVKGA